MVNKCISLLHSLLFPANCTLCGAPGDNALDICTDCRQDLPRNNNPCSRCAAPLTSSADSREICGECIRNPPPFDRCLTPYLYLPPIDSLISSFKFHQKLSNGRLLSLLLLDFLQHCSTPMPELIIPVPLHKARLTERGFNQSIELARPISREFRVPLEISACQRRGATHAQMNLGKQARRQNVKNVFYLQRELSARHLVLVDDVITTGATVAELATLLKNRGAERVDVWALARTP
ncbi:MAG: ComF family protein [Gammaproteobacteria bacterium]|nr:ComF family protein [Gammaproteobacteria bacterium]MCB1850494.1 ComF family protein [Gammaproteobacteria bacterium]MCP5415866.1 ComF family protein [Chromatiaceae bacterium]